MQGTVSFFHDKKRYGFIESDDTEDDIFFHMNDVEADSVSEGDDVEFEQEEGDKGPRAVEVTLA